MKMYDKPVWGIYTVRKPDFKGGFFIEKTKVKVLGESEKMALIQLVCCVGNHRPGDRMKVRKHNVQTPQPTRVSTGLSPDDKITKEYDYSDAYWHD